MSQSNIPPQISGKKLDYFAYAEFPNEKKAHAAFLIAKNRLLQINDWHTLTAKPSAHFFIVDAYNQDQNRPLKLADYVKIDIPGPGSISGKGFDWVHVSYFKMEEFHDFVEFRLRPSPNPVDQNNDLAHFFHAEASITLCLKRSKAKIMLNYYGRNEKVNFKKAGLLDKIRNFFIGFSALLGLSNPQWKTVIDGIMSDLPEALPKKIKKI